VGELFAFVLIYLCTFVPAFLIAFATYLSTSTLSNVTLSKKYFFFFSIARKFFPIAFIGSILWIAAFSYLMVWWATIAGDTIGIPPEVSPQTNIISIIFTVYWENLLSMM
jgi:hypothetical protein